MVKRTNYARGATSLTKPRLVGMILNFHKGLAMHLHHNGKIGNTKIQEEKINMLAQMMSREFSGIHFSGGKGYSGKN